MFATGLCRAAIAPRQFFIGHTASRTTNEICRQSIGTLISASTASGTILPNCLEFHTHVEALIEATGRALLPRGHSDRTTCASKAHIVLAILDGALEESFARFTREDTIMEAAYLVTANRARTVYQLLPCRDT